MALYPEDYPQTVGGILRYERERRRYTIEKIAEELNIRRDYLEKIEADAMSDLPADIYTKNYIKRFAEFVKVDSEELLKLYSKQKQVFDVSSGEQQKVFSEKKRSSFSFILTPKIVRRVSLLVIICALVFYLWYQVSDLSSAPEIIILEPGGTEVTVNTDSITVSGSTDPDATLSVNGRQIKLTSTGGFQETIELQKGSNVLNFEAENELGKKTELEKKVFVE